MFRKLIIYLLIQTFIKASPYSPGKGSVIIWKGDRTAHPPFYYKPPSATFHQKPLHKALTTRPLFGHPLTSRPVYGQPQNTKDTKESKNEYPNFASFLTSYKDFIKQQNTKESNVPSDIKMKSSDGQYEVVKSFVKPSVGDDKVKDFNRNKVTVASSSPLIKDDINLSTREPQEQNLVKNKIISLANETIRDLSSQLFLVDKVHATFKTNKFYKLGYVVSYINKTNEGVTDLMKYIDLNRETWDVLQLLNAYEQIKKAKDFLSQSLAVLKSFALRPYKHRDKKRGGMTLDSIAWSYYDDTI